MINIAELLKDCPSGMELDCTIWDSKTKVFLEGVLDDDFGYPIKVTIKYNNTEYHNAFTKYGAFNDLPYCKCVIFPKGKTTWKGFHRPFKDEDIVFYNDTIAIFKEWGDETLFRTYVCKYLCSDDVLDINRPLFGKYVRKETRLATEEEKQKLFDAIKANGYKWNPETKTLEKLVTIFKVGDKIKFKNEYAKKYNDFNTRKITEIKDSHYILDDKQAIPLSNQYLYELLPNKFDITTLKPFESKVLVRDNDFDRWKPSFWGVSKEK